MFCESIFIPKMTDKHLFYGMQVATVRRSGAYISKVFKNGNFRMGSSITCNKICALNKRGRNGSLMLH